VKLVVVSVLVQMRIYQYFSDFQRQKLAVLGILWHLFFISFLGFYGKFLLDQPKSSTAGKKFLPPHNTDITIIFFNDSLTKMLEK
jgi:hypothetical protein